MSHARLWHFKKFKTIVPLIQTSFHQLKVHPLVLIDVNGSVTRLGDLLHFGQLSKPLATISLSKSPTFLGNFWKGVKINHFSSEIIFGQLL